MNETILEKETYQTNRRRMYLAALGIIDQPPLTGLG